MSKRDPVILLDDIMLAIQKIRRYTSQMDHAAFIRDELVIDGVVRNLEIIGEAARQLPEEFRRTHSQISWMQIAGLRNRIDLPIDCYKFRIEKSPGRRGDSEAAVSSCTANLRSAKSCEYPGL